MIWGYASSKRLRTPAIELLHYQENEENGSQTGTHKPKAETETKMETEAKTIMSLNIYD
jgi:hypothetical protein